MRYAALMIALLDSVSCCKGMETRPTGMQSLLQTDARVEHVPQSRRLALAVVSPSQKPRPPSTKHVLHVKSWMTVGWLLKPHSMSSITSHFTVGFISSHAVV